MWNFDHNTLPPSLAIQFTRKNTLHTHQTRMATRGKLEIKPPNTIKNGAKSFKVFAVKMLNQLDVFWLKNKINISKQIENALS